MKSIDFPRRTAKKIMIERQSEGIYPRNLRSGIAENCRLLPEALSRLSADSDKASGPATDVMRQMGITDAYHLTTTSAVPYRITFARSAGLTSTWQPTLPALK